MSETLTYQTIKTANQAREAVSYSAIRLSEDVRLNFKLLFQ